MFVAMNVKGMKQTKGMFMICQSEFVSVIIKKKLPVVLGDSLR